MKEIRPSNLPMLAKCGAWESSGGNDDTTAGTKRHEAYRRYLAGEADPCQGLSEEDSAAVTWAADYTLMNAPTSEHPLNLELHVNPHDGEFEPLFPNGGTLDAACGPHLFDLKHKERDYTAQMAAYALAMFQEHDWPEITVHLLFCENKRAQTFKLTEEAAYGIVKPILKSLENPTPAVCEYCGWCSKRLSCKAHLENVELLAGAREEVGDNDSSALTNWLEEGAHITKLEDPALMGAVLRIARALADWCDSAEFHAREMATKAGKVPEGFKLQTRQGNRFISSVADAFPLVGLPQAEFLKACECKPGALFETYASFHGLKKAAAERDVQSKLGEVIQRKPATVSLVAVKE